MRKTIRLIILSIFTVYCLNSCILTAVLVGSAIVAGGAVYYVKGDYVIEIPRDLRTVYNATIKAIQVNRKYSLKNQTYTGKSAKVEASEAGSDISIELTSIKSRTTEIKIRYGTLGDEKKSANLANEITKNIN
ncbi:membrane protein [Francisella halioticida]|uniref:DUF3568 domain-containing protein n=1 Tax=Francisella halioticida TaxID=549298 RepID=A0ABN5B026_9GAMM|nr:DUF3568 family protein [Francisella halioticida]ASG67030.1 hypothetical protein CDV26_00275 [Francisella halioticida]BCD92016.1 membrane protein [Francisella halioticida]